MEKPDKINCQSKKGKTPLNISEETICCTKGENTTWFMMNPQTIEKATCDVLSQILHRRIDTIAHPCGKKLFLDNSLATLSEAQKEHIRSSDMKPISSDIERSSPEASSSYKQNRHGMKRNETCSDYGEDDKANHDNSDEKEEFKRWSPEKSAKITKLDAFVNDLIHDSTTALSHSEFSRKYKRPDEESSDDEAELFHSLTSRAIATNKCREVIRLSDLLDDSHNYTAALSYSIAEILECMSSDRRDFVGKLVAKCTDLNMDPVYCRSILCNLFMSRVFTCNGWLNNANRPVCMQQEMHRGHLGMGLLPSIFFKLDLLTTVAQMTDYLNRCKRFVKDYADKHKLCFMCAAVVNMSNAHVCNVYLSNRQSDVVKHHANFDIPLKGIPSLHSVKIKDAESDLMVSTRFIFPDKGNSQHILDCSNLNFSIICSSFSLVDMPDSDLYRFTYSPSNK